MEGGTTAASSALPGLAEEKERSRSVEARKAAFSLAHGLTPISLFSEKDTARRRGPFSLSVGPAKDKLKGNVHRMHRSFEETHAGGGFFSDPVPESTPPPSQGSKTSVYPRETDRSEQRPPSGLSSDYESAATPIGAWSPATTDRSTPPYDSRPSDSPVRHRASPTLVYDSHLVSPRANPALYGSHLASPRANPTLHDSRVISHAGQAAKATLEYDTLAYDSRPGSSPVQHGEDLTPPYETQLDSPLRHRASPTRSSYDSRPMGPIRQRANRRLVVGGVGNDPPASASVDRGDRSSALSQTQAQAQTPRQAQTPSRCGGDGGGDGGGGRTPSNLDMGASPLVRKMFRFFQKRGGMKIGSAESPTTSRTPANQTPAARTPANHTPRRKGGFDDFEAMSASSPAAVPTLASRVEPQPRPVIARSDGQRLSKHPRAPFGGALLRPPSRLEDGGDNSEESSRLEGAEPVESESRATVRVEPEGDLEEGGVAAFATAAVHEREGGAAAAVLAEVDVGAATGASTAADSVGIVLPCAPSDEEKVSYYTTGRFFLVLFGTAAFCTLTAGMWLFTIASPYFFWFGGPTVFLMVYLICHYFGVAMWGKDFEPDCHAGVLKDAEEASFLPSVDVFLPVCNEDIALLCNTWDYVKKMDYPAFTVFVLDDGAQDDVRDLAAAHGFQYIRRDDRPDMKKAGNLRYAFARTSGEAVVIFDADFCPRVDFLRETTPYLLNPVIGILQTPQFFRWREEQTWVEQGAGSSQEFFYRMVQMNQDRFNGAVCVGSCGLYRRAAVEPFGGVAAISHSEDMYTGFKMTEIGYKIKYLPLCLAMGTCPDEPKSFFMQQYRWCMGSATLVTEKGFWSANISKIHKICFINGLLYYVATALLIFMAPIPIMLLIYIKADGVLWYHSAFTVPSILMAAVVVPIWASQPYGMACHRVRVIQCYAHLYALKDRLLGTIAVWVPSGGGASSSSSKAYHSSVWLMVTWSTLCTVLIVGGSLWRMTEFAWFHYVPAILLAFGGYYLNMSTLWY